MIDEGRWGDRLLAVINRYPIGPHEALYVLEEASRAIGDGVTVRMIVDAITAQRAAALGVEPAALMERRDGVD